MTCRRCWPPWSHLGRCAVLYPFHRKQVPSRAHRFFTPDKCQGSGTWSCAFRGRQQVCTSQPRCLGQYSVWLGNKMRASPVEKLSDTGPCPQCSRTLGFKGHWQKEIHCKNQEEIPKGKKSIKVAHFRRGSSISASSPASLLVYVMGKMWPQPLQVSPLILNEWRKY